MTKKTALFLALIPLLAAEPARGESRVNVNINVGAPVPVPIIVPEPPLFLAPPRLGFNVAVGLPYDMFLIDGRYYVCKGDAWYVGSRYDGPWKVIGHDHIPRGLRKHKLRQIRAWRDEEYGHYRRDRDRYRGKAYRPEKHHHGKHDHDRHGHDRDHDHGHDHDHDRGRGHGGRG